MGHYLEQWRAHVLSEKGSVPAKCRPLWDVLQGLKSLICRHILGPLVGKMLILNKSHAEQTN